MRGHAKEVLMLARKALKPEAGSIIDNELKVLERLAADRHQGMRSPLRRSHLLEFSFFFVLSSLQAWRSPSLAVCEVAIQNLHLPRLS